MTHEWQTPALFGALLILLFILLWRWHTEPRYKNFTLLHAVADLDGTFNADKSYMAGAFVVSTVAVVVAVIRNNVQGDVVLFVGAYAALWAGKEGLSGFGKLKADTAVKTAEIRQNGQVDIDVGEPRERLLK